MRIGASLVTAQQRILSSLAAANAAAALSTLRLATDRRVTRPADDPAAFLQIQALERDQAAVQVAIGRVNAAANVGSQLELKISAAMTHLDTIREKLLEDAGSTLSAEQRAALQLEIDAAVEEIDDLSGSDVAGRRLLNGSADYVVTGQNSAQIQNVRVFSSLGDTSFSGVVSAAATQASLTYTGSGGNTTSAATITLTGDDGSQVISVTNGQSLTSLRDTINALSYETGVTASVSGDTLTFQSQNYGSDAGVAVSVSSGTFAVSGDGTASGTDATVTINGQAVTTVDGNHVSYAANGLNATFDLVAGYTGAISTVHVSDDQVLRFALGTGTDTTTLALGSIHSASLGGPSGRLDEVASGGDYAGLGDNTAEALRIVDEAIAELTITQGQVAAFNGITVESSAAILDDLDVSLATALEGINGVNVAQETASLARAQLLSSNALAALAILQQQQASSLILIQQLAGQA